MFLSNLGEFFKDTPIMQAIINTKIPTYLKSWLHIYGWVMLKAMCPEITPKSKDVKNQVSDFLYFLNIIYPKEWTQ